jgi:glutaredoxin
MKPLLPQKCPIALLWLTWALYAAGAAYLVVRMGLGWTIAWLILVPAALLLYVRVFPRISPLLGYGRVDDEPAGKVTSRPVEVTLYSSAGCPFCPIVEERLTALKDEMAFDLERVDVTLRPGLVRKKGIRAVPVVEVGNRRIVGHATTRELAELIAG